MVPFRANDRGSDLPFPPSSETPLSAAYFFSKNPRRTPLSRQKSELAILISLPRR